jgi:hypothetical protein
MKRLLLGTFLDSWITERSPGSSENRCGSPSHPHAVHRLGELTEMSAVLEAVALLESLAAR